MGKWIKVIQKTNGLKLETYVNKNRILVVQSPRDVRELWSRNECWITLNEGTKICVEHSLQEIMDLVNQP